jgi:DNA-directed RNA polymerase specialized sigma24 family protein
MNQAQVETLYRDHVNMLRERCWSIMRSTGFRDFDELMSEAEMSFCVALEQYDPSRGGGSFAGYLHMVLNARLLRMVSRYYRDPSIDPDSVELEGREPSPEKVAGFWDEINHLSEDARKVVDLILDDASQILGLGVDSPPRRIRGSVRRFLHSRSHWSHRRIDSSFREIRGLFA